MKLFDGKKKHLYQVMYIDVDPKTKKHLQNMGITQGVQIKIMAKLGEHAFVLSVRGSRVALSKNILCQIEVNEMAEEDLKKAGMY